MQLRLRVLEMGSQTSLLNRQTIGAPTLYRTPKWKHGIKEPCSDRTMISRTLPALNDFFHRNRCLERDHSRLDRKKPAGKCQPAIVRLGLSVLEVSQIEDQAQNIPENAIRAV